MSLTPKKLILAGFAIVLLIGIPLMFFLLKQQKNVSIPTASTTLSLTPSDNTVNVGDTLSLDINVDPAGVNQVSFIKLVINYDTTKIATLDAGFTVSSWTLADGTQFTPSILQGPTYDGGAITVTISTGQSSQDAIKKLTKIGTVSFQAIGATETTPTQIGFATSTQVLSIGATDQFSQNILANSNPASITIDQPQPTPTIAPTIITPTPTITSSPAATASPTPTVVVRANSPVCASMTLNPANQGITPYVLTFTVNGSSSASTISKVTFNFGDGQTQDVTQNGGIGSNLVSVVLAHTYTLPGTYNASAALTDASGNLSSVANCTQTITVSQQTSSTSSTSGQIAQVSPSPLPPTGPNNTIVTLGVIGIVLSVVGAFLLFAL